MEIDGRSHAEVKKVNSSHHGNNEEGDNDGRVDCQVEVMIVSNCRGVQ